MQWNENGISVKITERLTFLYNNNVNIVAIQETKLASNTKPPKTLGWAAVRLHRHKNKAGGRRPANLIKETIPFVDNTAALPQSTDPHLEQQGISITMPNRQQLHIHNIYIPPRGSGSAGHNASIAHLSNNELSFIVGNINPQHSRWIRTQTKTKEENN